MAPKALLCRGPPSRLCLLPLRRLPPGGSRHGHYGWRLPYCRHWASGRLSVAAFGREQRCRMRRRRCRRSTRGGAGRITCRHLHRHRKKARSFYCYPKSLLVVLSPLHDGEGRPRPLHAVFPHPRGQGAVLQGRSRNRSDQVGFARLVLFCAAYSGIGNFSSLFKAMSLTRIRAQRNTGVPSRGLPLAVWRD